VKETSSPPIYEDEREKKKIVGDFAKTYRGEGPMKRRKRALLKSKVKKELLGGTTRLIGGTKGR